MHGLIEMLQECGRRSTRPTEAGLHEAQIRGLGCQRVQRTPSRSLLPTSRERRVSTSKLFKYMRINLNSSDYQNW